MWPHAALSAAPGYADAGTSSAFPAEDSLGAQCKYPGCRNPRQSRVSRRGAPPAYCAKPGHEPDAARRERRRRLRDGLPLDAALDHQNPQSAGPEASRSAPARPPLPQPRAAPEPGAAPIRVVPDEDSERGTVYPRTDLPYPGAAAYGSAPGWVLEPAEQARRLADQLALAAEAYEQLAGAVAARDAENAELRRRLQHAEQALRDNLEGRPPR